MGMLEDHLTEVARMRERDQKIAELQAELDKAHRLIGQSIQWQRDAEIKLLNLRTATIEECAREAEWFGGGSRSSRDIAHRETGKKIAARIRALKEQQK